MRARTSRALAAATTVLALLAGVACSGDDGDRAGPRAAAPDEVDAPLSLDGELDSGATWRIEVPEGWNGTLLVFGHGYLAPDADNVAQLAPDPVSEQALLAAGYALAASSYASTGWAVEDGIEDQLEVVDRFGELVAAPEHTIAWGGSMGALVTVALLEQHPDRFDGGLAACGVLAGAVAYWDQALDVAHGLRTLVAPDPAAALVDLGGDQAAALGRLEDDVLAAARTPLGAARIALVAALAGLPGSTGTPAGVEAQAADLVLLARLGGLPRAELEERVGGNPSATAADPAALLAASARSPEVVVAYLAAGGDLLADLAALQAGAIEADPVAREALDAAYTPTGAVEDPLITLHTTRDPVAVLAHVGAYDQRARAAARGDLVRHAVVDRTGHCALLPAEVVPVLEALVARVEVGRWPALDPTTLGNAAAAVAGGLAPTTAPAAAPAPAPAFTVPDLAGSPRFAAAG